MGISHSCPAQVRGRREGRGRGAWAGGATYDGYWKDEKRDGDGTYACAQSGLRYEGPWDRDAPAARAVAASPSFVVAAPAEGKDGKRATQSKGKGKKDEAGADAVRVAPGEVPVFWACGVTPQSALAEAALPLCVTHAPGHMFVCDLVDEALRVV